MGFLDLRPPPRTLEMVGTTAQYVPFTQWLPITGLADVTGLVRLTETEGKLDVKAAYQVATTDLREPGSWTAFGTAADETTTEVCTGKTALSPGADDFFIRFGVSIENDSTQSTRWNRATVQLFVQARD